MLMKITFDNTKTEEVGVTFYLQASINRSSQIIATPTVLLRISGGFIPRSKTTSTSISSTTLKVAKIAQLQIATCKVPIVHSTTKT